MDLVVKHRKETTTRIVQILGLEGIYRGVNWVSETRDELS